MNESLGGALRPLREVPQRLEEMEALDEVSRQLGQVVTSVAEPGSDVNGILSGTWMGHPLHPMLTDVAIGAYTGAVVLDLLGGRKLRKAADRLIAVGLVSTVPTVAAGLNDWSTLGTKDQRVGVGHATANAVASLLYGASWVSRKRGRRLRGRLLALVALAITGVGGFIGADLTYRRGAGVDHTAFEGEGGDWTAVADESELSESAPHLVEVRGRRVMLVRHDGGVYALADSCAHQGGPLHEGKVENGCVTCPWHSSTFRLSDGRAVTGPTAHPQPTLQVRVLGGKIELRL